MREVKKLLDNIMDSGSVGPHINLASGARSIMNKVITKLEKADESEKA